MSASGTWHEREFRNRVHDKQDVGLSQGDGMFDRYIGIDYSGAETSTDELDGLSVYRAVGDAKPELVGAGELGTRRWTRRGLAHWLVKRLEEPTGTLVGVDHAFSFPSSYFHQYLGVPPYNWDDFLADFQEFWQTQLEGVTVRSQYYKQIRRMMEIEQGEYRFGLADWLRLTDPLGAASVFDFMAGPRTVAFSTHAGLPWLRYIRLKLALRGRQDTVRFWPFDCWDVPLGQSAVVEVYPALWHPAFRDETQGMSPHRRDAYSVARWMSIKDRAGLLQQYFNPDLDEADRNTARFEGWILGVTEPRLPG